MGCVASTSQGGHMSEYYPPLTRNQELVLRALLRCRRLVDTYDLVRDMHFALTEKQVRPILKALTREDMGFAKRIGDNFMATPKAVSWAAHETAKVPPEEPPQSESTQLTLNF